MFFILISNSKRMIETFPSSLKVSSFRIPAQKASRNHFFSLSYQWDAADDEHVCNHRLHFENNASRTRLHTEQKKKSYKYTHHLPHPTFIFFRFGEKKVVLPEVPYWGHGLQMKNLPSRVALSLVFLFQRKVRLHEE